MNKKTFFWLLGLSMLAYWLIIPVRGYSFSIVEPLHSVIYFLLVFWALRKYAPQAGTWRVMIPLLLTWVPELMMRIVSWQDSYFSLSITVLPFLAMGIAILFYHYRRVWLLLVGLALWLLMATEVKSRYMEWAFYGHLPQTGVQLSSYEVVDSIDTLRLSDIQGDYLVLDVWSSTCGVCRREMPDVQALRDKYSEDDWVEVASLFVITRENETALNGNRIMHNLGCDIPVYGIARSSGLLEDCGIDGFPLVLILNEERELIFNGSLEFAERKLKRLNSEFFPHR